MTRRVFEINVRGGVSPRLLADLGATFVGQAPSETVIMTGRLRPEQVHCVVGRIVDLGLEVLELRRLPGPTAA